jgi:TRAP-type mannitol/chloroaromatic compound transport system permease small subunit
VRFRNFWACVIAPRVPMPSVLALVPMFTVMREMSAMDGGLPSWNICPIQPLMPIPAVCEGLYVKVEILSMAWRRGETMGRSGHYKGII